ncbi:MAG: class I SAM-dependent methyltransferase [Clostridia bacterium]|nr:class I SAM-dependent methyltransferase [Clostridia bacterium]
MLADKEQILNKYETGCEEGRAERSRSESLEFHYTKRHLSNFIKPDSRVIELGCGTGYYGMYFADKCAEYFGVDLVPGQIEIFRSKIASAGLKNVNCAVGDATDLSKIGDDSYDVVLCLGPMYHLSPEEREKCFAECARICKPGGVAAFAYITVCGVYAGACIYFSDRYPNELTNNNVFKLGTDDLRPGIFWFVSPEEIEREAGAFGFEKLDDLGTDFFILSEIVNGMDDEAFELIRPLYDRMTTSGSCTGLSNHALLICRKADKE